MHNTPHVYGPHSVRKRRRRSKQWREVAGVALTGYGVPFLVRPAPACRPMPSHRCEGIFSHMLEHEMSQRPLCPEREARTRFAKRVSAADRTEPSRVRTKLKVRNEDLQYPPTKSGTEISGPGPPGMASGYFRMGLHTPFEIGRGSM